MTSLRIIMILMIRITILIILMIIILMIIIIIIIEDICGVNSTKGHRKLAFFIVKISVSVSWTSSLNLDRSNLRREAPNWFPNIFP